MIAYVTGPARTGVALGAVVLLAMGCGAQHRLRSDTSVRVPADLPPSAAAWPRYPDYGRESCWTRPFPGDGKPLRAAPSAPLPAASRVPPREIVRRLLARFGDRRYVRAVALGPPPPITLQHLRGYFAGARPPRNALWVYVGRRSPDAQTQMVAEWEASLAVGALRDDFCAAGGAPLVGWTVGKGGIGLSDRAQALEQRFPNPTAAAFRRRVQLVGRRYGFEAVELRLLRPRQLAPLLVVRTDRDRKAFVQDVPAIMQLLDPVATGGNDAAITFEGFYFEARDSRGAFVRVENVHRGETEGGQWSWNPCVYPYAHSEPFGKSRCG
jgi:hypothetical protein